MGVGVGGVDGKCYRSASVRGRQVLRRIKVLWFVDGKCYRSASVRRLWLIFNNVRVEFLAVRKIVGATIYFSKPGQLHSCPNGGLSHTSTTTAAAASSTTAAASASADVVVMMHTLTTAVLSTAYPYPAADVVA